jgi:hypothetical protein
LGSSSGSSFRDFGAKFRAWDRDFGWTYRTAIFVALLCALVCAPLWILGNGGRFSPDAKSNRHNQQQNLAADMRVPDDSGRSLAEDRLSGAGIAVRPLYPYSVIPGGAYSREELARAVANDPVVAWHYADFDVSKARVIQLDHSEAMYVSYRIGGDVFWTKKPLVLPAGELLLTDGKTMARTRCGNRLSATPATPISPRQPAPEAMENAPDFALYSALQSPILPVSAPILPVVPDIAAPPGVVPPLGPLDSFPSPIPAPNFPIVGSGAPPYGGLPGPPGIIAPPPPVPTPEPGTLTLLAVGITAMAFVLRRKRILPGDSKKR